MAQRDYLTPLLGLLWVLMGIALLALLVALAETDTQRSAALPSASPHVARSATDDLVLRQ